MLEGENWGKEADFQITNRPEVQEVCIRGKALERIFNEVVREINLLIHRDPFATPYQKLEQLPHYIWLLTTFDVLEAFLTAWIFAISGQFVLLQGIQHCS